MFQLSTEMFPVMIALQQHCRCPGIINIIETSRYLSYNTLTRLESPRESRNQKTRLSVRFMFFIESE